MADTDRYREIKNGLKNKFNIKNIGFFNFFKTPIYSLSSPYAG